MLRKEKYVAVTIGPILDTIDLASSPSALWAASYMMSTLSKNICKQLTENNIDQNDIISPYYDPQDPLLNRNDGVGLFHDRIIYKVSEEYQITDFKDIREKAIKETISYFGFDEGSYDTFFKDFFLVSAVFLDDSQNPIMDSGKMLDCLELSKRFVKSSKNNPILSFFNSEETEGGRNEAIKKRVVEEMEIKNWQLLNANRNIRSVGDIANACVLKKDLMKKNKYYAVVRSDGDRISKIIERLNTNQLRAFSRVCLQYCSEIASLVKKDYGGIAVYSGGDDLLAIMPVENHNKNTVFDFTKEANDLFIKSFSENEDFKRVFAGDDEKLKNEYDSLCKEISLSFGIFVSYYKYPLYEALERSAMLLFGKAKSVRNCTAFILQKHAGQSEGLLIPNNDMPEMTDFLKKCVDNTSFELDEKVILSSLHKIELFGSMFNYAEGESLKNLFENTFDSYSQKTNVFLQTELYKFFKSLKENTDIRVLSDGKDNKDAKDHAKTLNYILRIVKFFKEKAGERDEKISRSSNAE